jgi:hypothetical protein
MPMTNQPIRGREFRTRRFDNIDPSLGQAISVPFDTKEVSVTVCASADNTKQTSYWVKGTGTDDVWTLEFSNPYSVAVVKHDDDTILYVKGLTGVQVDVHLKVIR